MKFKISHFVGISLMNIYLFILKTTHNYEYQRLTYCERLLDKTLRKRSFNNISLIIQIILASLELTSANCEKLCIHTWLPPNYLTTIVYSLVTYIHALRHYYHFDVVWYEKLKSPVITTTPRMFFFRFTAVTHLWSEIGFLKKFVILLNPIVPCSHINNPESNG